MKAPRLRWQASREDPGAHNRHPRAVVVLLVHPSIYYIWRAAARDGRSTAAARKRKLTMLGCEEIRDLYRHRAGRYDFSANAYYIIGFREWAYRRQAVRALQAQPGDTIVELGCGTGLNFELIERVVGPEGRIIGVDMTDAMLEQARRRVEAHGWRNVTLIERDIARYEFPAEIAGVISTFALTLVAECDAVIAHAAAALPAGGRLVVLDLKEPEWAPRWLVASAAWLTRPFGVTADLTRQHPWEAMSRLLTNFRRDDLYFGFAYVAGGTVGERTSPLQGWPIAAGIHTTPGAHP